MFRGNFETTIDAKGRTSLPVRFREILLESYEDERFFITNSNPVRLEGNVSTFGLVIYPYKEFCAFEERLKNGKGLGLTSGQLDHIKRWTIGAAIDCSTDKMGRLVVPPSLRKNAGLERDIVFVGSVNKVEIWSLPEWEKVRAQDMMNFPTDTEALAELGL